MALRSRTVDYVAAASSSWSFGRWALFSRYPILYIHTPDWERTCIGLWCGDGLAVMDHLELPLTAHRCQTVSRGRGGDKGVQYTPRMPGLKYLCIYALVQIAPRNQFPLEAMLEAIYAATLGSHWPTLGSWVMDVSCLPDGGYQHRTCSSSSSSSFSSFSSSCDSFLGWPRL